jgi:hypothetical protein
MTQFLGAGLGDLARGYRMPFKVLGQRVVLTHLRQLASIDHVDILAIPLWSSSPLNSCEAERGEDWVGFAG